MKHLSILGIALIASLLFGCKKKNCDNINPTTSGNNTEISTNNAAVVSNCTNPYTITLESVTQIGSNYEWVWSVQNPNPGNGSNGTVQDLSHWNITLGQCAIFSDIVSGAISPDGTTWTPFTPTFEDDPSFCDNNPVNIVKFDEGTSGTVKTYYKLVISKNLDVDMDVVAYTKSGGRTRCDTMCFPGFGCPIVVEEGCSFSQGRWFAKPNVIWPGNVTVGGKTYTQSEGVAIFNSSNAGGIGKAKKVFLQVAAIKLSGSSVSPTATVWAQVTIAENWLSTLPKLTPANVKNFNTTPNAVTVAGAVAAADSISSWIDYHHCDD